MSLEKHMSLYKHQPVKYTVPVHHPPNSLFLLGLNPTPLIINPS